MNLGAFELKEGMKNKKAHKNLLKQQINVKSHQASHIDVLDHMCIGFSFKRKQFTKKTIQYQICKNFNLAQHGQFSS